MLVHHPLLTFRKRNQQPQTSTTTTEASLQQEELPKRMDLRWSCRDKNPSRQMIVASNNKTLQLTATTCHTMLISMFNSHVSSNQTLTRDYILSSSSGCRGSRISVKTQIEPTGKIINGSSYDKKFALHRHPIPSPRDGRACAALAGRAYAKEWQHAQIPNRRKHYALPCAKDVHV